MSDSAIVKAQRDALAMVVARIWECSRGGLDVGGEHIEGLMVESGLAEYSAATKDDPDNEVEVGDPIIRLTELGLAALQSRPVL
jgi:hypothetical protein